MMIRDLEGHAPAGWYTVRWDGDGIIAPSMSDVMEVERVRPGLMRVLVKPSTNFNNGFFLTIERTNPEDPIRNIRVIMPGFEDRYQQQPFHPWFLHSLRRYKAIRFMDWAKSNELQSGKWADRSLPTTRTFAGSTTSPFSSGEQAEAESTNTTLSGDIIWRHGVPVEYMVLLCNILGADMWINVPYNADDDYVRQQAELIQASLRPDVKVYVEYSNEPWHNGFTGGQYAEQQGLALHLQEGGWWGGDTNEARICYIGYRTGQISDIWEDVFGGRERFTVVVATQFGWNIVADRLLACGNAYAKVDALAIGPYFGSVGGNASLTLDWLMTHDLPEAIGQGFTDNVAHHKAVADAYNVSLIVYEGGQGMVGDGSSRDLGIQANRDPRIRAIYQAYFNALRDHGVSFIAHFTSVSKYTRYGSWGLLEATDQDRSTAYKWQGLQDYMDEHSLCTVEPPSGCPGNCSDHGQCLDNGECACYYGYSGEACDTIAYIDHVDCGYRCTFDQGTCVLKEVIGIHRYYGCECDEGFFGSACSLFTCPNNCSWAGHCIDSNICSCYPGYEGEACDVDCGCSGHGRCASVEDEGKLVQGQTCVCDEGWAWDGAAATCVPTCPCSGTAAGCLGPNECGCEEECVYGDCFHGRCVCWAGATGDSCNVLSPENRGNWNSSVGINLGGPSYWSTQWIFVDTFKQSSSWFSQFQRGAIVENPYQ